MRCAYVKQGHNGLHMSPASRKPPAFSTRNRATRGRERALRSATHRACRHRRHTGRCRRSAAPPNCSGR